MPVKDLRVMGRATQGVRLIRLDDDDEIASVAKVEEIISSEEDQAFVPLNPSPETFSENGSSNETNDIETKDQDEDPVE